MKQSINPMSSFREEAPVSQGIERTRRGQHGAEQFFGIKPQWQRSLQRHQPHDAVGEHYQPGLKSLQGWNLARETELNSQEPVKSLSSYFMNT